MNCLQYLFGIRTTKKKASLLSETEYLNIYNVTINNKGACLQGGHHNSGARLFIALHGGRTQDNRYKLKHEILTAYKEKSFYDEDSQTLEQVAPRGSTVSVLRHFQDQTGKTLNTLAGLQH